MGYTLEVQNKKVIYLNGHQLIADIFDTTYKHKDYLIAYNSNHLVILSSAGDLILSEEGEVFQITNSGKYIIINNKNNTMGVYRYDGTLIIPFKFHAIIVWDKKFMVQKREGDKFIPYNL